MTVRRDFYMSWFGVIVGIAAFFVARHFQVKYGYGFLAVILLPLTFLLTRKCPHCYKPLYQFLFAPLGTYPLIALFKPPDYCQACKLPLRHML